MGLPPFNVRLFNRSRFSVNFNGVDGEFATFLRSVLSSTVKLEAVIIAISSLQNWELSMFIDSCEHKRPILLFFHISDDFIDLISRRIDG